MDQELTQIEDLLETLVGYHHPHFRNSIHSIQLKFSLIYRSIKKDKNPTEFNNKIETSFDNIKNHFSKDCFKNAPDFLRHFVDKANSEYNELEIVIEEYIKTPGTEKSDMGRVNSVSQSIVDSCRKLVSNHKEYFLTIINDILNIYEEKGGDRDALYENLQERVKESDNKLKSLADMWKYVDKLTSKTIKEQKDYILQTKKGYPIYLKNHKT